jgi:hypothetical protein
LRLRLAHSGNRISGEAVPHPGATSDALRSALGSPDDGSPHFCCSSGQPCARQQPLGGLRETRHGGFRSGTRPIPANQDASIFGIFADTSYQAPPNGNFHHAALTVMLRSGSVSVQVDFDVVVDATEQGTNGCHLYGTATRAT